MNKEELIKNQFPNDEFLQSAVLRIVDKCIAELEKENAELKNRCANYEMRISQMEKGTCDACKENEKDKRLEELENENTKLKTKYSHDCPNCVAFGKHCPHKVNGDPYFYDCYLTVGELEKENTELKTEKIPRLERKIASIRGAHSVDCKKLNARLEQVERLKKENAELKEEVKNNENLATVAYMQGAENQKKKYEKQLTKTKEIIREYMRFEPMIGTCSFYSEEYEKTKTKAEQFLKEISE